MTVLTMAYAIGHISGCQFNPAVSLGLARAGASRLRRVLPYVIAQVLGGMLGAGVLYLIASGKAGFDVSWWFCIKRIRRTLTWWLLSILMLYR